MPVPYPHFEEEPGSQSESKEDLERLLLEGVSLPAEQTPTPSSAEQTPLRFSQAQDEADEVDEADEATGGSDLQGALALFAEAAQDMATAALELSLGRHFACVDYCNQVAEKAAQAVCLLHSGRRSPYNHDLRALGERVGAPAEIVSDMAALTPFHPEAFYAETPPEEADEVINAEEATACTQRARRVLRWARGIIFKSI
jgi:HEPN domain-containing protein